MVSLMGLRWIASCWASSVSIPIARCGAAGTAHWSAPHAGTGRGRRRCLSDSDVTEAGGDLQGDQFVVIVEGVHRVVTEFDAHGEPQPGG
ncbi:hypothetical protein ACPXB3_16410 [Gordonia sp. DT219]|uniref:hypothetical protein n=1 Tax=Gordonia sp. DT219 TaxID=3416658 RepID=UPI003CEB900D